MEIPGAQCSHMGNAVLKIGLAVTVDVSLNNSFCIAELRIDVVTAL
jgi:hypothetical protein